MNFVIKTITLFLILLISSCTLQDSSKSKASLQTNKLTPVVNPCKKLDALLNEHDNNFDRIKSAVISTRISKIWQAKYHLVGNNCQVWAWGGQSTTYACSMPTPNEEVAQEYFNAAIATTQKCLSNDWQVNKSSRQNKSGYKAEFTTANKEVMVSVHMVPTAGLFASEWTVYYYVGTAR